jgi:hypothetical protein
MTMHRIDAMAWRGATCLWMIAILALGAAHAQHALHDLGFTRASGVGSVELRADVEDDALMDEIRRVEAEATMARGLTAVDGAVTKVSVARDLISLHGAVAAFADVDEAIAAGYEPVSACMTGDLGAQGIHFGKDALFEPSVVLETPQLLMYEPQADGSLRFLGVEYLVFQQAWHDAGHVERPALLGQTFDLNETLLDEPFYLLHVWLGQFNPSGLFANWNPLVACRHEAAEVH